MSFTPITLQPSGPQTAGAAGTWVPVPTGSMIAAVVDITGATGSPSFFAWLQGTNDPADSEGFDVPADLALQHAAGGGAANTTRANERDIVTTKTDTAAQRNSAIYKHFPFKYCRLRWAQNGVNASVTFSSTAGVK